MEYYRSSNEDSLCAGKKILNVLRRSAGPIQIEYLSNLIGPGHSSEIMSHLRRLRDEGAVDIYSDMVSLLRD